MPQSYSQSEQIHATPSEIRDWLNDWDNVRAWMGPSLVSIEMLSDHNDDTPMCEGMRYRETRKMGKMNAKANIEVLRHDTDGQGVFRHQAVFDDGCNRIKCEYEFTPDKTGTNASFLMYNAPNKWWTRALCIVTGPMMIKMCAKEMADHLQQLKVLVEQTNRPAAEG